MPIMYWIIAAVIAVGGGTGVAANASVPGDPLYGLDQAMEQFQEKYMLWTQAAELDFHEDQSEERLDELEELEENVPDEEEEVIEDGEDGEEDGDKVPGESALKAIEFWEQHHKRAMERLQESVDKGNLLRAGLENDLKDAETERERERIQNRINQLENIEAKRTQRLERTEGRDTLPGAPAIMRHVEKMQSWNDLGENEQEELQEEAEGLEDDDDDGGEETEDEDGNTGNNSNNGYRVGQNK